ncbi:MAG: SLATT domain-containing protein [Flavipsychrobacter sp.]|nr:SLATT domain-containing protein [Flavipsychrobacter sp.]
MSENKFPSHQDHLNKTFLEELSYKIWVTKGSRFYASKRHLTKNDLSNKANGFLSAYLIIFGLFSVYQISKDSIINENFIAFGSTAISILLLAFSQMEAAQDYKMKAHFFHDCALKLSKIYNEIRIFKTLKNTSEDEREKYAAHMSKRYQAILDHYTNHDDIDFKRFKAEQKAYYQLKKSKVLWIHVNYYWHTKILYHFLIIAPLLLTVIALLIR